MKQGFKVMDSDIHVQEPHDLWAQTFISMRVEHDMAFKSMVAYVNLKTASKLVINPTPSLWRQPQGLSKLLSLLLVVPDPKR